GRLAHGYLFTGVRGVGKTTTARILARALNCIGVDGASGPTVSPCGECEPCQALAEARHVDVLEMDAASHTGVDDIRDIIDGVRYRPVSARYKVYIIDEVHMLTKNAFNALLKTLEEPPEQVIFIFATTEIRKVPMTVLSRCQRFDLRRVEAETLGAYLADIATRESVTATPEALALVARAADGSVRDGLSILDQAIAHSGGTVEEDALRHMLGLADRAQVFDLFEAVMAGEAGRALDELARQYSAGVDPVVVLQDLLELAHWLTRVKVVPDATEGVAVAEAERRRGADLAARLSMPVLARTWQMLLKGLGEARFAPNALAAAEMVLVRLAYVADLPAPVDVVKAAKSDDAAPMTPVQPVVTPAPVIQPSRDNGGGATQAALAPVPNPEPVPEPEPAQPTGPASFEAVATLVESKGEMRLLSDLRACVHLVDFEPGRIEFRPNAGAPKELANDLSQKLSRWTGERWIAVVSGEAGAPTLDEQQAADHARRIAEAGEHPLVAAVLETFADAKVTGVRDRTTPGNTDTDTNGDDQP
ncbi:MAG: DNA polymerase III subunit gamma/tau, partial [Pseudomonadota bacterium]|nr:DNA polymerase III subunit gamma/tau [Pseudomonadota bacterium]